MGNSYTTVPEENLGGNITVLLGLVPGLADDATLGTAKNSALIISRNSSNGGGDSGGGGSGLKHIKFY